MRVKNVFIVILIFINSFLLVYILIKSSSESDPLANQIVSSAHNFFDLNGENVFLDGTFYFGNSDILIRLREKVDSNHLSLLVVISDSGCVTCIENEVTLLNSMVPDFEKSIIVVSVSNSSNYLQRLYGFNSEPISVNPNEFSSALLNKSPNPLLLVLNSSGDVLLSHFSETSNLEKSEYFNRLVKGLLN